MTPNELRREQRPFVLWAQAEGDFERAVELIPAEWPAEQRELWRAPLELIRDNEHIRRGLLERNGTAIRKRSA